jgi:hypothetical protein
MVIRVIAMLTGSRIGRWVALAVLACLLAWTGAASLRRAGKRAEQAKQAASRIKSLQTALRANNEITNMSAGERRDYVARWVSDNAN